MAAHAICGGEIVVVVDVALRAGSCGVGANKCEAGDAVIEAGLVGPRDGVVAARAIRDSKGWASG